MMPCQKTHLKHLRAVLGEILADLQCHYGILKTSYLYTTAEVLIELAQNDFRIEAHSIGVLTGIK